ncbi:MAG: thermostable hemolysin [Gammaproteobacteria bacterium]|nr:thermostable hemolysin [Gammaproteobacteria bacterium]
MQPHNLLESNKIQLFDNLDLSKQTVGERQLTERFIHDVFNNYYAADIQNFLPFLLQLTNDNADIVAALGFRPANNTELFLENYLNKPVEQLLAGSFKQPVDRNDIVEIGNLAIGERGAARSLIVALTGFLFAARYKWCVFTIAKPLINTFRRMDIELEFLTPANNNFMNQQEKKSWGSYYQHNPQVMACRVDQAYQVLTGYILKKDSLISIWLDAQQVGSKV